MLSNEAKASGEFNEALRIPQGQGVFQTGVLRAVQGQ
jgi:hypothetical protein